MLLILLAYLGGVLTIVSPCILPVLPFVFSRAQQPFRRSGLPLLLGMALTFALVASLAAVGGGWVVAANQYGRWAALVLVALFGITLLWPGLADRLTRPLVALGARLSERAGHDGQPSVGASLLLGVATGLLWAPCAGPILGLILTGAALQGASIGTSLLLLAYAAGAATSMAAALLLGGKVFAAMKRSIGAGERVRQVLGGAMLAGVAAIALGWDTGALAQFSIASTGGLEQQLVDKLGGSKLQEPEANNAMMAGGGAMMMMSAKGASGSTLPDEGLAPELVGATDWLNGKPLTAEYLKGKVVLVDFWTYSCINCLRTLPYVKAWAEKYGPQGLVVVGVHAPEFAFERDLSNVKKAVKDLGVTYPVAVDNEYKIWRAFRNQYWPAHYFIDATGRIRHHHFGEGNYAESERVIQQLLREAGKGDVAQGLTEVKADGIQAAADMDDVRSPETYVGYERAANFASAPKAVQDKAADYSTPAALPLNAWGLDGRWTVGAESATLAAPQGRIVYRFQARDLHLVLGPGVDGKPVRFRVLVDGQSPGASHGSDVAADGSGTVTGQRLYQLVRQNGDVKERTFSIEFLDAGASAYAFTFG